MDAQNDAGDDLRGRRDVALNILRPSTRLLLEIFRGNEDLEQKVSSLVGVDDMFQQLVDTQDSEQQQTHSEILNNIAKEMKGFLLFVDIDFRTFSISIHSSETRVSQMPGNPEDVVRFFDSAIHILYYICSNDYIEKKDPSISWAIMKEVLDKMEFLRNIRWIVGNKFTYEHNIPAVLAFLLCSYFAFLVEDEWQGTNKLSMFFKLCFSLVREQIYHHVKERYVDLEIRKLPVRDDLDNHAKIIDQQFVIFFDHFLDKLRAQCFSHGHYLKQTAIEELSYMRSNLLDVLQLYSLDEDYVCEEMDSLCFSTLALIVETAYPTYFSDSNNDSELQVNFSDLIIAVDSVKLQTADLYCGSKIFTLSSFGPSSSNSNNRKGSVNCLIDNLEKLFDHHSDSIPLLKPQTEAYYQEMEPVRKFLAFQITSDQMSSSQKRSLTARFNALAQQANFIVELFLAGKGSLWQHKLGLFVVTNEAKMAFKKINPSELNFHISPGVASLVAENPSIDINAASSSKESVGATHFKLVGVKNAVAKVVALLTRGPANLKIISIVGMPGLGKTTVANSVYENFCITKHFIVLAWCCSSQAYKKENLLADMLCQVVGKAKEEFSGDDPAEMLYRKLKGRRYLIVIDDVWDIELWHDLRTVFPDDMNGSRILFTTRHVDVARKAISEPFDLRLLSDDESCKLLWLRVFDKKACPFPELSRISRKIARNCKGLPLAVVLVAGVLRRTERKKKLWEEVAENVISSLGVHGNHLEIMQFRNVLDLSYRHLPVALRPCFLYFAAFPEGTWISVSKLIQLWISEEFVQENVFQTLEEEAESYLKKLIDRSLVMVAKTSSKGGVKACRVHDVLHDFCSERSMKENLIAHGSMPGGISRLHSRSCIFHRIHRIPNRVIKYDAVIEHEELQSERPVCASKLHRRMEVLSVRPELSAQANKLGWLDDDHFIFRRNLLRVLDLEKVGMKNGADTCHIIMLATTLVHLRFLGIRTLVNEIPVEIGNLRKLETLSLTGVIGNLKLPESLWKLPRLRNVLMDHGYFSFQHCSNWHSDNLLPQLCDLRSVSTLFLRHGHDDVENHFLRRLPCLRKLACRFAYSWDSATGSCVFPVLDFLEQLESLKLFLTSVRQYPCKLSFPSNLKKLSLSNSRLPWDKLSAIMKQLRNLEVLKLLNKAFEGQQWDMGDDETLFSKLKFLKLDSLDIQVWNAEYESLPSCLERLVVLSCPQLQGIPSCFGEISTLKAIEMKWCSSSAMNSVNQVLQVQREFSNDDLKVTLIAAP